MTFQVPSGASSPDRSDSDPKQTVRGTAVPEAWRTDGSTFGEWTHAFNLQSGMKERFEVNVYPGAEQAVSGFVPGIDFTVSGEYRPYVTWVGNQYAEKVTCAVPSYLSLSIRRSAVFLAVLSHCI